MRIHGIQCFIIGLFLTRGALVAAQTPPAPAAAPFEALPRFEASAILPGNVLQGPNHRVQDRVNNDGYYNHYRITSPEVGVFDAISTRMLEIRIPEINALVTLKKANDAAILAGGAVDAFGDMFAGAVTTVTNPVQTLEAVPAGLNRLFGFASREVARTEEKIDANEAATQTGQGASTLSMVGQGSESVARGVLGVNTAERQWAQKLGVDPYTTNPVLRKALNRVAELEAAGRFSKDLVPGGAVLTAISAASSVNDLVYKNWDEVERLNEERLTRMGVAPQVSQAFRLNRAYSETRQTRMIAALDRLQGLPGRAGFVERAARADTETRAQFFQEGAELVAIFHRTQAPLARLVPEAGGAGALTADNRILQILNVDYMVWTQDLADHADRITAQARSAFPGARPEVWLTGQVSPRVRDELHARGWAVHERGLRIDPQWP
jgi:hypothetical protein